MSKQIEAVEVVEVVPEFYKKLKMTERPAVTSNSEFTILGDFCQILHLHLKPGQGVQVEPGVMCYMSEKCKEKVRLAGIGRMLSEGTLMKGTFENQGTEEGYIGLTPNLPGNIVALNLSNMGGSLKAKRDAFMAAVDTKCQIRLTHLAAASCVGCCCADAPFFMQEIRAEGWVFLNAHGTVMQRELDAGEEIVVEGSSLVACSSSVTCDAVYSGSCGVICCGGEGMFNTALKGPGLVVLSSMPIEKLRSLFPQPKERSNPKNKPKKDVR